MIITQQGIAKKRIIARHTDQNSVLKLWTIIQSLRFTHFDGKIKKRCTTTLETLNTTPQSSRCRCEAVGTYVLPSA